MKNKTKGLIIKVLEGKEEMGAGQIGEELGKEGYIITYDTICRNLKSMFDEKILNRNAKSGELNENTKRRHWNFYYSLK